MTTDKTPPELSILIVSYNTREMTLACLDSVRAETKLMNYEIVVVDNASIDGSAEAIRHHPSNPQVIEPGINLGFAAANNLAASVARGEMLLLLNPDTLVLDSAIDKLLAFARSNEQARIWGGRTVFADRRLNPASAWGRMTLWRLAARAMGLTVLFPDSALCNGEAIGGWDRSSTRHVDIVSGCFLMISKSVWQKLNGFDPAFFMYGEEADLCLRAHALGARPIVSPEATIVHYGGASETTREGKMVRLLAAKALLIKRHFPTHLRWPGLALHAAWPLSRLLATRLVALVVRTDAVRTKRDTYERIWSRRREWWQGFPEPTSIASTASGLKAKQPVTAS